MAMAVSASVRRWAGAHSMNSAAHAMVDTFPDARLAVIEGAGLFAHEERPAEVTQALLPLLTA